ncbi:hypothetical protein E2320_003004 [Naja naja]|nr:hypothetical protein E2320_003004 [Naja naja]
MIVDIAECKLLRVWYAEMQRLETLVKKKTTSNDEQAEEIVPKSEQTDQPVEETNIQDDDPPVQQLESVELSDLVKMLKEKLKTITKKTLKEKDCLPFMKCIANE